MVDINWMDWIKQFLVGGFNPSEKYSSIGMIIPNIWENKIDVPNHQPAHVSQIKSLGFREYNFPWLAIHFLDRASGTALSQIPHVALQKSFSENGIAYIAM